jgi:NAD(P)-dependent dehydrogenase (short-subunit alcohol dehydrogenase family)
MIAPFSFHGKTALVTGAGRGLGMKALTHAQVKDHAIAIVIAISRTKETLDELKSELPSVTTICSGIGCWEETREVVQSVGRVDLLVNNAAINIPGLMMKITPKDIER